MAIDRRAGRIALALALLAPVAAHAADPAHLTAPKMFDMAARADAAGDMATVEAIYRALAHDPDLNIRSEARFRHAQLLERRKAFTDAALLLRAILDEAPKAQPARLELAKVLALMGQDAAARRELRQAQAGGLPPQVDRLVNQFAAALRAARPFGGSLEVGLAPSTNINRATRSATLNSTLGPLDLSRDARARSGTGLALSGQAYARIKVSPGLALTANAATQNILYRTPDFDDSTFAGTIGARLTHGRSLVSLSVGPSYRLYGTRPYTVAINATLDWQRALGKRSQIDLQSDFGSVRYKTNALQDGQVFTESLSLDHAFSPRFGGRLTLFGQRMTAADPGYATAMGGTSLLLWREIGRTTAYVTGSVSHLGADARLFLYQDRRREWLDRGGIGATFRQLQVKGFAPLVRVTFERNVSTVGLYDYRRLGIDLAITRAF